MKRGFTLIELSIVLVIIALVVGGVMVGKDMIEATNMRSLITQVEKYNTAVNAFKGKYNCLPGDCANATQFFTVDSACTTYGASAPSFRPYNATTDSNQTCRGDGSGAIFGPSSAFGEYYLFWQHLSLGGSIDGNFTGLTAKPATTYTGSTYYFPGANAPNIKLDASAIITILSPKLETPGWTGLSAQHYFWLGSTGNNLTDYWEYWPAATLTTRQALSIDLKTDDGLPRSGAIQSDQRNSSCYSGTNYNSALTDKRCSMLFAGTF